MNKKFLNFALFGLLILLVVQSFFAKPVLTVDPTTPITIETTKNSFNQGKVVELRLNNHTDNNINLKLNECPEEPFTVINTSLNPEKVVSASPAISCEDMNNPHKESIFIKANSNTILRYNYWSNQLFSDLGRYKIQADLTVGDETFQVNSNEFQIQEAGIIWTAWKQLIYRPIYNGLIAIINYIPGNSLGAAIILLTILIRGLLYGQNRKALTAQKKMNELQPELNKLKEKYKNNQQKIAEETMKLWQKHKVNPASGCLPMLIQFPLLIALYFVVQDGINPDQSIFLYSFLSNFDYSIIQTNFLNILQLTKKNIFVLPLIVGGLQFTQIYLTTKKKNKAEQKLSTEQAQMQTMQNTMLYFMPAMIAVISASLPAGVGLYWGTSTLFGIIQQLIINKQTTS